MFEPMIFFSINFTVTIINIGIHVPWKAIEPQRYYLIGRRYDHCTNFSASVLAPLGN